MKLALLLAALPVAAIAQVTCGPRPEIVAWLESDYGETRQSMGLATRRNSVFEVFASAETGTWTILATDAQGRTCLVAAGRAWEDMPAQPAGAPA